MIVELRRGATQIPCFLCALWLLFFGSSSHGAEPLKVQLQWVHQSQFAGLYMAKERRHFEAQNLSVQLLPLTPGGDPIAALRRGEADIAVSNFNNAWNASAEGAEVVNVAQIFSKSALGLVCRVSQGIIRPEDIEGKRIGVWNIGDENLVLGILQELGIEPTSVEIVPQKADAFDLIAGNVHCATAMSYNEQLSLLNAGIPDSDLLVLKPEMFGLANIEDAFYVRANRLSDPEFFDAVVRFVRAARLGWEDARLAPSLAIEAVLRADSSLDRHSQRQMLEAVLRLIPADPDDFGQIPLDQVYQQIQQIREDSPSNKNDWSDMIWTYRVLNEVDVGESAKSIYTPPTLYYIEQFASHQAFKLLVYFGVFIFALKGLLEAINRGYDIWGRIALAMLSGVGGGTLRDIIIGGDRQPFYYVVDVTYTSGILAVVIVVSLLVWWLPSLPETRLFQMVKTYSEMIGFSCLATTGAVIAVSAGMPWFWIPVCAALTCAGGGMLRDIVINREPLTFRGVVYEEVAIIGGLVMAAGLYLANGYEHSAEPVWISVGGSVLVIFVIKLLVHHYDWRYPTREAIQDSQRTSR